MVSVCLVFYPVGTSGLSVKLPPHLCVFPSPNLWSFTSLPPIRIHDVVRGIRTDLRYLYFEFLCLAYSEVPKSTQSFPSRFVFAAVRSPHRNRHHSIQIFQIGFNTFRTHFACHI